MARASTRARVAALEFATGVRATVLGKPARAFFREGIRALPGPGSPLPADEVAMVGDDVETDVLAAQRRRPARHPRAERQAR